MVLIGGAGACGVLAPREEEVVEEEADIMITFSLPKPNVKKKKEKKKEKTAVKAAADAAEQAAEDDSGAAEVAAETVVVRGGGLRDLEVLSIGSDPIDKTSEAADRAQTAGTMQCPLVAAMVTAEAAKGAAVTTEETAAAYNSTE